MQTVPSAGLQCSIMYLIYKILSNGKAENPFKKLLKETNAKGMRYKDLCPAR